MITSAVPEIANLRLNPALTGKYDDQPLFIKKLKRANQLLAKAGAPKLPQ